MRFKPARKTKSSLSVAVNLMNVSHMYCVGRIRHVAEGDLVRVGVDHVLQCMDTPGHTPGSVCLRLTKGSANNKASTDPADNEADVPGVVFTGDTLFIGRCVGAPRRKRQSSRGSRSTNDRCCCVLTTCS